MRVAINLSTSGTSDMALKPHIVAQRGKMHQDGSNLSLYCSSFPNHLGSEVGTFFFSQLLYSHINYLLNHNSSLKPSFTQSIFLSSLGHKYYKNLNHYLLVFYHNYYKLLKIFFKSFKTKKMKHSIIQYNDQRSRVIKT